MNMDSLLGGNPEVLVILYLSDDPLSVARYSVTSHSVTSHNVGVGKLPLIKDKFKKFHWNAGRSSKFINSFNHLVVGNMSKKEVKLISLF